MSSWINYHHLLYFKTIAEEGSVSRAAEKLRLGQPTLSAQLKQFEEALGVQLFERQHKKLNLTEQGKVALEYARGIFKMGSEMVEVLHDRLVPTRASIAIGAIDNVPKQIVLRLVKAALKVSPCQISLLEGHPDELLRELGAHRIDLLLTDFVPTATEAKGLIHRCIARNRVSIFGAPKFIGLQEGFPRSISAAPMILPTYDSKMRYDIDHWAEINGLSLNVVIESQDISVKKLMAVSELGLLPAASHAVAKQVLNGELIRLGNVVNTFAELHLIAARRKIANPIARTLLAEFSI